MPVRLKVVEGPNAGTVYFLGEGESKVIGRSGSADITIPDPLLSRHHLMVRGSPDGGVILDLDSSNGTFVNGRLVREAHLASGDVVKLGGVTLEATLEAKAALAPAQGDKVETVRALLFCSRCMRAKNVGDRPPRPFEPFVCDKCRSAEKSFDPDVLEGYKLTRKVGDDVNGPVYRAFQLGTARESVVRFYAPQKGTVDSRALEQFLREARTAGRLQHANVVETVDAGERNGVYFVVEEAVPGTDLADRLRAPPPLALEEGLAIASKVAAALVYGFAQEIVHLYVRPSSIYLGQGGVVKLGDFGLARTLGTLTSSSIAKSAEWRGLANYIPPEQLVSTTDVDQRADVYALGAVLYHIVCGQPPFDAPTAMRVVRRIGESDLTPVATLAPAAPRMVRLLIERCMEREPVRRYQTPQELLAAIDQARAKLGFKT